VVLCGLGLVLVCDAVASAGTEMAVTVDDLPTHGVLPRGTSRLAVATTTIDALRRHAAPSVYGFVNGGQVGGDPELETILRAWRQAGFLLGNHTFSHLDLGRVTADKYIADIERNEPFVERFGAPEPFRYFRFPFLSAGDGTEKDGAVRRWLTARGYTVAPVTVSFEDWAWNEPYARCVAADDEAGVARLREMFVEAALAHLAWSNATSERLFGRRIKHVLVLHFGAFEAFALDDMLRAYEAAGVTFVTLDAAMRDPVYQAGAEAVGRGKRTFLGQTADAARVVLAPDPPSRIAELDRVCR
jgi:peptidoglycan/xylan/chitin deacetylase (PgdA/CDA1 family)